jgi:hypothetical protein
MTRFPSRLAASAALLSSLSMIATPAFAAQAQATSGRAGPIAAHAAWEPGQDNAARHRDDWGDYRRYGRHRHGGVDAGDVIAGVLILGGIAAIASAASKNNRDRDARDERRYPEPDYRGPDYRDDNSRYRSGNDDNAYGSYGLDRAVDSCTREVERDAEIDSVDGVDRNASGWLVNGRLRDGRSFSCSIDASGMVRGLDYGGASSASRGQQWNDDDYDMARRRADDGADEAGDDDGGYGSRL